MLHTLPYLLAQLGHIKSDFKFENEICTLHKSSLLSFEHLCMFYIELLCYKYLNLKTIHVFKGGFPLLDISISSPGVILVSFLITFQKIVKPTLHNIALINTTSLSDYAVLECMIAIHSDCMI